MAAYVRRQEKDIGSNIVEAEERAYRVGYAARYSTGG